MRKLILALMAMLLMAGTVSAGFIAFYKTTTSPYKMMEYAGAPERVNLAWDAYYNVTIDFSDSCDVSDSTPIRGIDGRIPCTDIRSPYVSMTFPFRAPEVTTKEVYTTTADTIDLSSALFDVFYKGAESPYKMRAFNKTTRVDIMGTPGQTAIIDFSDSCDASDAISPEIDSDGRIECMDIRTDGSARIAVSSWVTGEVVTTKEAFIYMHAPAIEPTCDDPDGQDTSTATSVTGISASGDAFETPDACDPLNPNIVLEAVCVRPTMRHMLMRLTCPEGKVCVAGACARQLSEVDERNRRWEEIGARVRGVKLHLNSIEKKLCGGANLPAGAAVANSAGSVNSIVSLEREFQAIYTQMSRIEKCRTGKVLARFIKTANTESNVAKLLALTAKNADDLKKATLKAGGVQKKPAAVVPSADKEPVKKAEKTAAKKSFWSRLFRR